MHFDLEHFAATDTIPHADVCIIGAGIAGLVLAGELAGSGLQVTLLEAGGLELEPRSQSLYDADMPGTRHTGTTEGRFRTFGGSSTRWGGQLLSYPPDILQPVPGAPSRAWPLHPADLEPFYARVLALFGVPDLPFDAGLLPALGHPPFPLAGGLVLRFSRWAPFARRNLAHTLGKRVLAAANIRLFTHANVAELAGPDGRLQSARVLDYAGRVFSVTADRFVVCCGTVESSRLLLLSRTAVPDPHGQVGRGFSDHISLPVAELPLAARTAVQQRLGPFFSDGVLYTPKLEAASTLQRDHDLLAVMAHFTIEEPPDSGIGALRDLLTSLQRRHLRTALTRNLLPMLRELPEILQFAWQLKVRKRRAPGRRAVMRLHVDLEQDPGGPNFIALSPERDALGLQRARVHWQVTGRERDTLRRFVPLVRDALCAAGLPELTWDTAVTGGGDITPADTYHPLGGLRMGTDPRDSVTGLDLRVHGTKNLWVASCAVFPSGGSSNPTFTMMALTLRLADQLRQACECGRVDAGRHRAASKQGEE